jgi:hypothetical protein
VSSRSQDSSQRKDPAPSQKRGPAGKHHADYQKIAHKHPQHFSKVIQQKLGGFPDPHKHLPDSDGVRLAVDELVFISLCYFLFSIFILFYFYSMIAGKLHKTT